MSKKTMGIIGAVLLIAAASLGLWLSDGMPSDLTLQSLTSGVLRLGSDAAVAPSLDRELSFSQDFPAEARAIVEGRVTTLKEQLTTNKNDASSWLDLAIQYKTIGDYEGAVEVWKYLVAAYPADSVSAHNLGNIYHLFLKDYPQSEKYYREAIARNSTQTIHYLGLHELYRYSYKQDTNLAVEVIDEGLQKVPNAPELIAALAGYYKEKGDKENAVKYFTQLRDAAQGRGDASGVAQFNAEINALK